MSGINARDRRVAVSGAVMVGCLVAIARGVPVYEEWERDRQAVVADAASELEKGRDALENAGRIADSLRARRSLVQREEARLLSASSPAALAAALAARLELDADDAGDKVNSIQLRADTVVRHPLNRIGVRLSLNGDVRGLAAFIRLVEVDSAIAVVRELTVTQPEPAGPETKPEVLRIDVLVEALGIIRDRS